MIYYVFMYSCHLLFQCSLSKRENSENLLVYIEPMCIEAHLEVHVYELCIPTLLGLEEYIHYSLLHGIISLGLASFSLSSLLPPLPAAAAGSHGRPPAPPPSSFPPLPSSSAAAAAGLAPGAWLVPAAARPPGPRSGRPDPPPP